MSHWRRAVIDAETAWELAGRPVKGALWAAGGLGTLVLAYLVGRRRKTPQRPTERPTTTTTADEMAAWFYPADGAQPNGPPPHYPNDGSQR